MIFNEIDVNMPGLEAVFEVSSILYTTFKYEKIVNKIKLKGGKLRSL
jgi:hypothetical protein